MKRALLCTFVLLIGLQANAQTSSALINEALDKQVKLQINATLPQAMKAISDQTGVPLRATQSVWDLLPWGEQTNISATIENQTLREALDAITRKLGLRFELKDEAVEIYPMHALARLGRRATVQELNALDLLDSTQLGLQNANPTVQQVIDAVDAKLVELKSPVAVENRAAASIAAQVIPVPRNATMAKALEEITHDTSATWYPWGKSILIVGKDEAIRSQLSKTISTRYSGVDVGQVLVELSRYAGVPFNIEPGALQRIPPEFRSISLIMENAPISQVLQNLCGITGLSYTINDKGIYIWNQSNSATTSVRDPIVGMIPIENGVMLFVPQSQVPADVKEYLKTKNAKWVESVRQQMKKERFKPATTQPTTREEL